MSKLEQLESIAATVRDRHGPESIVIMGQDHVFHVPAISTGVLPLDIAIGIGGFPRGRIVEIYGTESSGKSTICLAVMAACQQMGEPAALVDSENTFDPVWADKIGVKVGELLVSQPDSGEEGLGILETLVRTGEVGVVCIDSVAALVPQAELEGDIGDAHVGRQARLMSQALRMLTSVIRKSNCVVIFTNQIREKIGIMFGSPNTTPGGRALRFYASVRVETKRRSYITAGSGKDAPKIGINVGCNIVKNKVAPPFKNTECELYFDRGFDVGAVFCDTSSVPTIVNNLITYNSSINGGSLNIKNASAKIVNNIITGAKSSDSNQRLSRWYKDNLFARYVYDGAKLDNVTYYFGFINNGEPGEVQYSGCAGFNGSVWAETGERFWVEAKSHVDTWGEGGGLNVTVSLDTSEFTIFVKREVDFIYYYCKAILSPIINSFGNANEGLAGVGIVVDNQDNMPLIAYNNVFGNPGGGYAFSDTTETKSAVQFDLTGTNGNISSDPLMNSETYELLNGSPCIDAGIADTTGLGIGETDFLGNPRFFDASAGRLAIVDIGAFEFQDNLVGIEETVIQGDEFRYSIMPNPTNGIFNFRINSEPPEKLTIKLINAQGQVLVIRSLFYPVTNQIEQFDVSHLSKGIYYFVLTTDKHRESRKIVIQ